MIRRKFIHLLTAASAVPLLVQGRRNVSKRPTVTLLRHATIVIDINGKKILVDPMLSAKGEMDPVGNSGNDTRIPMVELPINQERLSKLLTEIDAVIVTHTHRDHWDAAAQKMINKETLIFCQPSDAEKIQGQGFVNVQPIKTIFEWEGLTINRTGGRHGTGEIGQQMGEVSGFVIGRRADTIYIAGDTIWCDEVRNALERFSPDIIVVNAGGARFLTGDPITMTPDDIAKVRAASPGARIVAVHMDTVNHCLIRRTDLKTALMGKNIRGVSIIRDGESVR